MLLIQKNKQKLNSVGCVSLTARSIGLKLRLMILSTTLIFASGCSELALLGSLGGMAASQNTYAKIYSGTDFATLALTDKSIKMHVYEKGKKYIVDYTRAKALGIMSNH